MAPTTSATTISDSDNRHKFDMAGSTDNYDRMKLMTYVAIVLGVILIVIIVMVIICKLRSRHLKKNNTKGKSVRGGRPPASRRGSVHPNQDTKETGSGRSTSGSGRPRDMKGMRQPTQKSLGDETRKLAMQNLRKQKQETDTSKAVDSF